MLNYLLTNIVLTDNCEYRALLQFACYLKQIKCNSITVVGLTDDER